ncbi:MAG: type II toxin-antitoxin system RelE family toxin [Verrucomicrobiales bacterium]
MLQIVFNALSAAELSRLDTLSQLELLNEFKIDEAMVADLPKHRAYGKIERDGRVLYRYRARDYRLYFEVRDGQVIVHRVLHKNTLDDFLYRSSLPLSEDEALGKSKTFWKLIEEGEKSGRAG